MSCGYRISASRGDFPFGERKHLAMVLKMWAFGDESGGVDTRYCLLGGFVASERQWKLFRRDWDAILKREGVPAFHAVEFFQPASFESSSSPYTGWRLPRRKKFLADLLGVIERRRQIHPIGSLVDVRDFLAMHPDARRMATGGLRLWKWNVDLDAPDGSKVEIESRLKAYGTERRPYPASFFGFIKEALEHTPDGAKLHFMFDLNEVEEGLAHENYGKLRKYGRWDSEKLGGIRFESASDHAPIQLADLYSYVVVDWVTKNSDVGILLRQAAEVLIGKRKRTIRFRDANAFEQDLSAMEKQIQDAIDEDIQIAVDAHDV